MLRQGALLFIAAAVWACSGESPGGPDAAPGLHMYRDGILPSGEPMTALVGGDVPIVGTQFSCESCHGRSGMGASEGAYIIPPVAAQFLFAESPQPKRPAYDRESLARVLREGVTPSGRRLSAELMPRYVLTDADADALTSYLETLSAGNSPGVDATSIRFATILVERTDPGERAAMLAVLNRFAEEINRKTRNEDNRWDRGYTPESKLPTAFREWRLEEWTLSGPPDTWDAQLQAHYEASPVFAIVSGGGDGSWKPVSIFCERNRLPCLFPSVDLPYRDAGDFYTVYFSRGLLLEADLIAAHIAEQPVSGVVQVWCDDALTPAFDSLRNALGAHDIPVESVSFECGKPLPVAELASRLRSDTAAVLWLKSDQLSGMGTLPESRLYLSSSLLGSNRPATLAGAAGPLFVAHLFKPPGSADPAMRRFELWARSRGVEITHPRQQAEAFFACLVLNDAVKHMGRFYVREYALDMMDHAEGMSAYLPLHARPGFGPGQRFINKGGYVMSVINGHPETDMLRWISP